MSLLVKILLGAAFIMLVVGTALGINSVLNKDDNTPAEQATSTPAPNQTAAPAPENTASTEQLAPVSVPNTQNNDKPVTRRKTKTAHPATSQRSATQQIEVSSGSASARAGVDSNGNVYAEARAN